MSLSSIQKGRKRAPLKVVCYGRPGIGKTTWASTWPAPIFLGGEDGTGQLDVDRLPVVSTLEPLESQLHELTIEDHDYRTVVVDTLDSVQPLVHTLAFERMTPRKGSSFASIPYGAGPGLACEVWTGLLARLDLLQYVRGMHVLCLAHSVRRATNDPTSEDQYDRQTMALAEKSAMLVYGWSDAVLYATTDDVVRGRRQVSVGEHILECRQGPGYEAKTRYTSLPDRVPMSWDAFSETLDIVDGPCNPQVKELHELTDQSKHKQLRSWLAARHPQAEIQAVIDGKKAKAK